MRARGSKAVSEAEGGLTRPQSGRSGRFVNRPPEKDVRHGPSRTPAPTDTNRRSVGNPSATSRPPVGAIHESPAGNGPASRCVGAYAVGADAPGGPPSVPCANRMIHRRGGACPSRPAGSASWRATRKDIGISMVSGLTRQVRISAGQHGGNPHHAQGFVLSGGRIPGSRYCSQRYHFPSFARRSTTWRGLSAPPERRSSFA